MIIQIDNLSRRFGKTLAVDRVSFEFGSGQTFGFVGPNGAGKTTTMRILATLDEPSDGDIRVDGRSVIQEPEACRRLIGYMPDSLPAHGDIDVHEYIDFFARAYGIRNPARGKVVAGIEEFTNLIGIRGKRLSALSKGMKQRVSLARALVHDPPLLVLDEPAAGLDPRARIELRELLRALRARGKAILISSHILSELAEVCDGAVIIERGRILRAGTMRDIVKADAGAHRTMLIRVGGDGDAEPLLRALLEMPGVEDARMAGHQVEADVAGGEEVCCDLLAELLRRGFRVAEFRQRQADLEQVFMSITTGEVQ